MEASTLASQPMDSLSTHSATLHQVHDVLDEKLLLIDVRYNIYFFFMCALFQSLDSHWNLLLLNSNPSSDNGQFLPIGSCATWNNRYFSKLNAADILCFISYCQDLIDTNTYCLCSYIKT